MAKNLTPDRQGPRRKSNTTILVKEHCNKMIPNSLCYTHKSAHHSAIIREASAFNKWEQIHRPKPPQCAEQNTSNTLKHSVWDGMLSSNSSTKETENTKEEETTRFYQLEGMETQRKQGLLNIEGPLKDMNSQRLR